jgi:hypothetical protein
MKKILIFALLALCIILVGCANDITQGQSQITTYEDYFQHQSFIKKLNIDDNFTSHFESDSYRRVTYISDDLLVYESSSMENLPERLFKVVTENGIESFSVGRNPIYAYLSYDSEYSSVYYMSDPNSRYSKCIGDAVDDFEIDYQLPVEFMTVSFFGSNNGVYDFLGNSYHQEYDYEQIISFNYYPGDEMVFYSYVYGQSVILGYNLTKNETFDAITLKDDLKLQEVLYSSKDYAIIGVKYGGFIAIDKENNIEYFLRDEHSIAGYNGLIQGLANFKYPFFEFNEIDGNDDMFVVANPSLSTFITVSDYKMVQYIDENVYVLLEEDGTYYFYDGDTVVYSLQKNNLSSRLFFSKYLDNLLIIDYREETIDIFDTSENIVVETLMGTSYYHSENIYAYIPTNSDNQLTIYNMEDNTKKTIEIDNLMEEKSLFYIKNEYFILYDELEVTLYNAFTLETETFEYISLLSRVNEYGRVLVYGLLVENEGQYYLIG